MSKDNNNRENEHLLQHKWALWFRPPVQNNSANQSKIWQDSQKITFEADTVEGFWRGFHNLPRITPSHPVNCDYSLFKDGVQPMWEDPFNKDGGRWTFNIERRNSNNSQPLTNIIEQVWLDVMLCLIGEGFDPHGDLIAGGVCGLRGPRAKESMSAKLHIWTRNGDNYDAQMAIGTILKEVVHAPDGSLSFSLHNQSGNKRGDGALRL